MKKYFLYARKSSEADDRQVQSIEDQIKACETTAKSLKLQILETLKESMSAKVPEARQVFNSMLQRIKSGECSGILVWNADRLSRNAVDTGRIIDLFDTNKLNEIVTQGQTFRNTPNDKFLFSLLCSQAKLENDNRGINAKRGMTSKAEKGWYPAPAPIGYKNTPDKRKGFKTIEPDEIAFPLVRNAFDKVLSGKQPILVWREIHKTGLLLGKSRKPISRSAFYYMLTNPFYYGDYKWPKNSGNWYHGGHLPMLTKEEFDVVQKMLGRQGKPVARRHTFDLTGLMRCAECGCAITASEKVKYYKSTNRIAKYIYYHCSRKHPTHRCVQAPITESSLNIEISELLLRLRLKPEFIDWARKWLKELYNKESAVEHNNLKQQNDALENIERRLGNLLNMRLDEKINEETYESKKKEFEDEKETIKQRLGSADTSLTNQRIKIENALDFAYAAYTKFNTGTRDEKQEVMVRLGSNLMMENKKVRINLKKYLIVCSEQENWKKKYKDWLEPQEYTELLAKRPDLRPAIPIWLPLVNAFKNREIEFGFSLQNIQTVFETLAIQPAFVT